MKHMSPSYKPTMEFGADLESISATLATMTAEQLQVVNTLMQFSRNLGRHQAAFLSPVAENEEVLRDDYNYYNDKVTNALYNAVR